MLIQPMTFGRYQCSGVDLGTTAYYSKGAAIAGTDSKVGTLSVWVRIDGGDGTIMRIIAPVSAVGGSTLRGLRLSRTAANEFDVVGLNAAGTVIFRLTPTATFTAGPDWYHILISYDLTGAVVNNASFLINGNQGVTSIGAYTDDTVSNSNADIGIGATAGGGGSWDGCIAELWYGPGIYLDFAQGLGGGEDANIYKFRTPSGKPANLGSDGSRPTGVAPLIYMSADRGGAVSTFTTNRGSGGGMTASGSPAISSSSPSD